MTVMALRATKICEALLGQGVSDRLARQWISEHGDEYIAQKLNYVAGQGKVKSTLGYLTAVIRDDYTQSAPVVEEPSEGALSAKKTTRKIENG